MLRHTYTRLAQYGRALAEWKNRFLKENAQFPRGGEGTQGEGVQVAPVRSRPVNELEVASGPRIATGSGSSPAPRTTWPTVTWAEKLGASNAPYLVRWVVDFTKFSLRLHRWNGDDDLRNPHDHEWDFWTILVCGQMWDRTPGETGGYVEGVPSSWVDTPRKQLIPEFFPAEHRHSVRVGPRGAWTIMLCGPKRRRWGFWVPKKGGKDRGTVRFRNRNKYFLTYGHH